jgi:hypothetical protein
MRCKRCGEHYYHELQSLCVVTKNCPCNGNNANCSRCAGLGVYKAHFESHKPEENQ